MNLKKCIQPGCREYVLHKINDEKLHIEDGNYCKTCPSSNPDVQKILKQEQDSGDTKTTKDPSNYTGNNAYSVDDSHDNDSDNNAREESAVRIRSGRVPLPTVDSLDYFVRNKYRFDDCDLQSLVICSLHGKTTNLKTNTAKSYMSDHARYLIDSVILNNPFHLSRILLWMGSVKHGGYRKAWTKDDVAFSAELVVLKANLSSSCIAFIEDHVTGCSMKAGIRQNLKGLVKQLQERKYSLSPETIILCRRDLEKKKYAKEDNSALSKFIHDKVVASGEEKKWLTTGYLFDHFKEFCQEHQLQHEYGKSSIKFGLALKENRHATWKKVKEGTRPTRHYGIKIA